MALTLALAVYLLMHTALPSSIVNHISMQPGLIAGQRLIVNKIVYHFREPQRGEIIILYPPVQSDQQ
jgi:signal peptidase I